VEEDQMEDAWIGDGGQLLVNLLPVPR
jgi:hypothetical protein